MHVLVYKMQVGLAEKTGSSVCEGTSVSTGWALAVLSYFPESAHVLGSDVI